MKRPAFAVCKVVTTDLLFVSYTHAFQLEKFSSLAKSVYLNLFSVMVCMVIELWKEIVGAVIFSLLYN